MATETLSPAQTQATLTFDGKAVTLCGDYRVANGRIHVIDAVLAPLPPDAAPEESPDPSVSPDTSVAPPGSVRGA